MSYEDEVNPQEEPTHVEDANTFGQLARVEIDTQIATARAFPRSLSTFKSTALKMATLDEETAASCFYSVPRAGKMIQGPSARMAEIIAVAWRNLRFGARIVSTTGNLLTAQGACHDLESNVAITYELQRRITDKKGRRYNDDMIVTTGNAALSIALRNAVLKVVPKAYWGPIFDQARQTAIGNSKTLVERRTKAVEYLQKMGVLLPQILGILGRKTVEEIDLDDLEKLRGLITAIKDGDTTVEDAFPIESESTGNGASSKTDALKDKLKGRGNKAPEKAADAPQPPKEEKKDFAPAITAERIEGIRAACRGMGENLDTLLRPYGKKLEELTQTEGTELLAELTAKAEQY